MCKNLLEGVLVLLVLLFACGCVFMNKNKYTLRLFLAVIIVLSLIVATNRMSKEGFSDSLTLVDANNLIDGDTRLQREQKQTNRELDVLEGQIRLMKRIYQRERSERRRQNIPTIQLRCTPPTAFFEDGNVAQATPEYEGLNIDDLNITADQLQNLINRANTLTD